MGVVEIVYISAIVFPFLATAGVMWFVARAIRKHRIEQQKLVESQELTDILEEVVENQDKVLSEYRRILD